MSASAIEISNAKSSRSASPDKRLDAFVSEMAELSHKYAIGIAEGGALFFMEHEDCNLIYEVDQNGALNLTVV
jgi:hypothetical protein